MPKTKLRKKYDNMYDRFRELVVEKMLERFGIEVENHYSIFAMRLITNRVDGEPFTPEQHAWLGAYSDGYIDAMEQVYE